MGAGVTSAYSKEEKEELMEVMALMRDGGRNLKEFKQQMDAADLPPISYASLDGGDSGWRPEKLDGEQLSPVELLFIQEITIDWMPVDAVNRIKEKNPQLEDHYKILKGADAGFKLLSRKRVIRHLKKLKEQALKASEINIQYVLTSVKDITDRCQQAVPVLDRNGDQVYVDTPDGRVAPAYGFDAKNSLAGLKMLGDYLTMWTKKTLIGSDPDHPLPEGMPTKQELKEAVKEAYNEIERDY